VSVEMWNVSCLAGATKEKTWNRSLTLSARRINRVRGTEPPPVDTPEISMWRDINIFNEVGIPSATFGMPRKSAPGIPEKFIEVRDLMDAAKMYALVALEICR
jgi:hypothetical protein